MRLFKYITQKFPSLRPKNIANSATLLIITIFLLAISIFLSYAAPYDHDENQFVASSAVFLSKGAIPYLDYAYFHMPYGVFINSIALLFSNHTFLSIRIFTSLFWVLTFLLIFIFISDPFNANYDRKHFFWSCPLLFILLFDPSIANILGKAFNHAIPTFFSTLSAILLLRIKNNSSVERFFLAGVFIGIAVGVRSSFAAMIIPMAVYLILWFTKDKFSSFFSGIFVSLLPAFVLFIIKPNNFIFGNLNYITLNTLYRHTTGYSMAMGFYSKAAYIYHYLTDNPQTLFIYIITIIFSLIWILKKDFSIRSHAHEKFLLILLILFQFSIGIIPTPLFIQYLFGTLPLIVMLLSIFYNELGNNQKLVLNTTLILLILPMFPIVIDNIKSNLNAKLWDTTKINIQSQKIKESYFYVDGNCKALTLMPILALESNCDFYDNFVTGSFAWRITPYIPDHLRTDYKLVGTSDLADFLSGDPPTIILTDLEVERLIDDLGHDIKLERPFRDYAKENNYVESDAGGFFKKNVIWVKTTK